jgi:hypothetical protein
MLPTNLDETAKLNGAIVRKRAVKCASILLRLAMAYSFCGLSLRETATWALRADIANLSDVALLKRLKNAARWFGFLLAQKLMERSPISLSRCSKLRIRLVDATGVSRPGSKGTDFKLHLCFSLDTLAIDRIELTDAKGGESLTRVPANEGDVLIGDRGYAHRKGILSIAERLAYIIVRLNWQNVPLLHPDKKAFDIIDNLKKLGPTEVGDFPVLTAPSEKDGIPSVAGRLVALRKSPEATEKARRKLRREAKKKGKTPDERTLESCGYIFLFTTLPVELMPAVDVLELYRYRWQIELMFKRMKSILYLDEMAAKDDLLCRTFLQVKLLSALLVEDLTRKSGSFSPWGYGNPSPSMSVASLPRCG